MIPQKAISILEALSTYKFLTRLQMARLGIEKYNSAFTKYCGALVEANYIGLFDARNYGIGHIYYLRKKGAQFIARENQQDINEIKYCASTPKNSLQTLFHRTGAIDCQIELFLSCQKEGIDILFYDRDIETLGNIKRDNNLIRKTRVPINNRKFLEPDAIFMLNTPKGKKLYCLEFENTDYTKKSFEKVQKHVWALNMKSPSKKYQHDKAHRTLFIYKNPATMKAVMQRVKQNIGQVGDWFLFKTLDKVKSEGRFMKAVYHNECNRDFINYWSNVDGAVVTLY